MTPCVPAKWATAKSGYTDLFHKQPRCVCVCVCVSVCPFHSLHPSLSNLTAGYPIYNALKLQFCSYLDQTLNAKIFRKPVVSYNFGT